MNQLSKHTTALVQQLFKNEELRLPRSNEILSELAQTGDIAAASQIAPLLSSNSVPFSTAVARTIETLLANAAGSDILALDEQIRTASQWAVPSHWRRLKLAQLNKLVQVASDNSAAVPGVLSCHPNGRVRERAVQHLAKFSLADSSPSIPYLLVRLNDWVPQVRDAAKLAVFGQLKQGYTSGLVENLELVFRLTECKRDEHTVIIKAVVSELRNSDRDGIWTETLGITSRPIRRRAYRFLMETPGSHHTDLILAALASKDEVLRLWAAKDARKVLPDEELANVVGRLEKDSFAPLREERLMIILDRFEPLSVPNLSTALLDRNASVRSCAQFYLKKIGNVNLPAFYRSAIRSNPQTAIAVYGLGETGGSDDLQLLKQHLQATDANVRSAAVWSIGLIAGESEIDVLKTMVCDTNAKVARTACHAIASQKRLLPVDQIMQLFNDAKSMKVRRLLTKLLAKHSGYSPIPCLIEAAAKLHDNAMFVVLRRIKKELYAPKAEQERSIVSSLNKHAEYLPEFFKKQLREQLGIR